MKYIPDQIFIEPEVETSFYTQKVLSKFQDVQRRVLPQGDGLKLLEETTRNLFKGKKTLFLKAFHAEPAKICPGYSDQVLCCNYYVINLIENCPLECSYCILQAYLNKTNLTFHVNVEEIMRKTAELVKSQPNRPFRIGTGEHSDSLAMDSVFEVNAFLVESFAQLENATLELKTKTDEIEPLLGLDHKGHTVIAWSLNPQELIDSQEIRTASLEQRLKAAKRVVEDGYKVAFHFDPILHYQGWQAGYEETVELIFEHVSPRDIAWISMGTFRYIPKLKAIAEERFKRTAIFANEFIMAEDGKMRYLKPIRTEMLSKVSGFILKKAPKVPLYLCMEKRSVWDRIFAEHPQSPAELEAYLNSNLK